MTDIVERLNDSLSAGYSELRKEAAVEIMRLRAKIAEMEKQEPVGWIYTVNGGWDCYSPMKPTKDAYDTGSLMPRYALPSAQAHPAPSVPDDGFRRGVECAVAFVARKAELYLIRFGDDDARRHVLSVLVDELCGLFKVQPAPSAPEVTDAMALAFHSALTDGSIGEHELEEIKVGLRAALAAAPEAKP